MTTVPSPHDRLFRSAMADIRVAREFFQRHLPENIKSAVNLDILNLHSQSYIDNDLKLSQSDILYQTQIARKNSFLYLLCEHQSKPVLMMPFRLLKYCVGIWNDYLKQHDNNVEKLPLIIAMVFYNGKEPYTYSMDFKDLLDASPELIDETWGKPFKLINLQQISDEEIRQAHWSGVLEFFMKHAFARDFIPFLKEIAPVLAILENENGADYVVSLINYALITSRMADFKTFSNTIKNNLTLQTGEKIMTLAELLIEQGKQKGEHNLLVRQLKRKFPAIHEKYLALIENADEEMLLTWGERLLDAKTPKEIFGY